MIIQVGSYKITMISGKEHTIKEISHQLIRGLMLQNNILDVDSGETISTKHIESIEVINER